MIGVLCFIPKDVGVRSYLNKNVIDIDKLSYHLEKNSETYGKNHKIQLYYQVGNPKPFTQNIVETTVLSKIVPPLLVTGKITIATHVIQATSLKFGIRIDCCQTWKYLILVFEKLNDSNIYLQNKIEYERQYYEERLTNYVCF